MTSGVYKKNILFKRIWRFRYCYLLLLPAVIYVAIFNYAPMYGIQIAFRDYKVVLGFLGSPWIGLTHFKSFINSYYFALVFQNTLIISLYSIVAGFPIPIIVALAINELRETKFRKFIQTVLYAPHFISVVVLVGMLIMMLSPSMGILNAAREALGFERLYYMAMPEAFRHIYVWSGIWQTMGWSSIIYIAALSTVDPELHEAARIDGASRRQRIQHINLPAIAPTITILLILQMGQILTVGYEKIWLMQNKINTEVSEVIATYVYRRGIMNLNYSFSAAVGLFNNVINVTVLLIFNGISRKVTQTSLF